VNVDAVHLLGPLHRAEHRRLGGQVHDSFEVRRDRALPHSCILELADVRRDIGMLVPVSDQDLVTRISERTHHVATDEAGAARDKDPHADLRLPTASRQRTVGWSRSRSTRSRWRSITPYICSSRVSPSR
jgi:hypothetical protein